MKPYIDLFFFFICEDRGLSYPNLLIPATPVERIEDLISCF